MGGKHIVYFNDSYEENDLLWTEPELSFEKFVSVLRENHIETSEQYYDNLDDIELVFYMEAVQ